MQENQNISQEQNSNNQPLKLEEVRDKKFNDMVSMDYENNNKQDEEKNENIQRPEYIPEDFWDEEKKSIKNDPDAWKKITNLEAQVKGLRTKLSRSEKNVPNVEYSVEEYAIGNLSDEEKSSFGDVLQDPEDPLILDLRDACVKHKITPEQYNGILKEMALSFKGYLKPEEISPEEQRKIEQEEINKLGTNGRMIQKSVISAFSGMYRRGEINDDQVQYLKNHFGTSEGVSILYKILSENSQSKMDMQIPVKQSFSQDYNDGLPTDNEIKSMMIDKRVVTDSKFAKDLENILNQRMQSKIRPTWNAKNIS